MNPCTYRPKVIKERRLFFLFATLSILTPLVACVDLLRPVDEAFSAWFQRSGSAMVVFALIAEMKAYQMLDVFKPVGFVGDTYMQVQGEFKGQAQFFNVIAFLLIAIATVIWGYGDLLVENL